MKIKSTLLKMTSNMAKKEVQTAGSWPPICPTWIAHQPQRLVQLKAAESVKGQK